MTREEAINTLNASDYLWCRPNEEEQIALNMAIEALSAPSGDLISRADAIRWVKTECNPYGKPTLEFESGKRVIEHLKQMPSAEADRPTGEWKGYNADNPDWLRKDGTPIFLVCDKCHDMVLNNSSTNWNYCPNCGARMKGGDDE